MTSKQRAALRSMANTMPTILYIGKGGITKEVCQQAWDALEAREIIKVGLPAGAPRRARPCAASARARATPSLYAL